MPNSPHNEKNRSSKLKEDVKSIVSKMNGFIETQDTQNVLTNLILARIDLERPTQLKKKIQLI
jgi:hypothetical protein